MSDTLAAFYTIPLAAVPSQSVAVSLGDQPCRIDVYQKTIVVRDDTGRLVTVDPLFLDLYVNDALVIGGVLCLHAVKCVRDAYLGFTGDLVFYDTQPDPVLGPADPLSSGLGARWILTWQPGLA